MKFFSGLAMMLGFFALLSSGASAHHSSAGIFDRSRTQEIEGTITEVLWRNPHILFTIEVTNEDTGTQLWEVETTSVSVVSRTGLTQDLIEVGSYVKVAGSAAVRADHRAVWATNMLLPNNQEILLGTSRPRWSSETIGASTRNAIATDPTGELGLFRVWTSAGRYWNDSYPLTAVAIAARATFDPVTDKPTANCAPKGVPFIMENPYPMEFVDQGDEILLRIEEYDLVRRIVLAPDANFHAQPDNLLGRSVGHWEGEVLVVETDGINYPHFDKTGIPQSKDVKTLEYFSVNADGSQLNYRVVVTDPVNFTEPVVMTKTWAWRPGEMIRPYNCIS